MIEDEVAPVKAEKRTALGDAIKNAVAKESTSLHPKGDKAVTVRCVWAISITINEQPHTLRMLPLLDPSLMDKLILLRILKKPDVCPAADDYEGFTKFAAKLRAELPGFAHFLMRYEVPAECRGTRSLVKCFRCPELMDVVNDGDDVGKLAWLIETSGILNDADRAGEWCGTADDLETELRQRKSEYSARLFVGKHTCGYLLRSLKSRFPTAIKEAGKGHGNVTKWRLSGPFCTQAENTPDKGS
jgi:hypothetical protein